MTYQQRFGKYAVKEGINTLEWFKDLSKAEARFAFYASAPEELEGTLRLVEIQTGKVLKEVEPEEEAQMTIRDFVKNTMVKAMEERLNDLMKIGAPAVMIDGQRKAIEAMANGTMKIGGDTEALDDVYASHEVRKGTGGRQYFAINGNVNFFPNARYGMFIKRA